MNRCLLDDRAIVAVSGEDAESFLNRLLTNSMLRMSPGTARYAALLSPQGKLLFDFLVLKRSDQFWIDVTRDQAPDFARRLKMFKLRAKVEVEDLSAALHVAAAWEGALMEAPGPAFRDPRHNALGYRIVASRDALEQFGNDLRAYDEHRIHLGIPRGGIDFAHGDTFVHDANIDLLHGIDFDKGCYVGQEVVSRVQHRGSARKRIVKLAFYGDPPGVGATLQAGALQIGAVTSVCASEGMATARTDRLEEAETANQPVMAGTTLVGVTLPVKSTIVPPSYAEDLL